MPQLDEPKFDLFELTHLNEAGRRVVNDDVTGKLREDVEAYLADLYAHESVFVPFDIDPSDLEGGDDDADG